MSVKLWLLFLTLFPGTSCYRMTAPRDSDTHWVPEVTLAVLRDSLQPNCTVVFITDGGLSSRSLLNVVGREQFQANYATYEIPYENPDNVSMDHIFNQLDEIHQSSRSMTLVLASDDDHAFLSTIVKTAIAKDIVVWPTRLLVLWTGSSAPYQNLQTLRGALSDINAMLIVMENTTGYKRCGVYVFLPYSHRMVRVASFTLQLGLKYVSHRQLFPDKFYKLADGANLTVVGQNFPPHVTVRKAKMDGAKDFIFSGPLTRLLKILSANINFTYNLVQPSDGSWGILFPNGTWNGMVGMLLRKDADFALGPFGITYLRAQAIDYTNPLVVDYGQILGRRGNTEIDPWSFVMALTPSVWIGMLIAFFFILTIVKGFHTMNWNSPSLKPKISVAAYVRSLLVQDIDIAAIPGPGWEKLLLGVWMLSVLILIECYSTNLTSLLAVRYISEPYQSVRDMLDDPKLTSIWFDNTAYIQFLSAVDSGIYLEVAESGKQGRMKLITPSEYASVVDEYVSRGDHVMINPYLIMKMFLTENYMEDGNCKFYVSKERFLPLTFCMVVQKYSPLLGPINEGIRAVVEGGIYDYWLDEAIPNTGSCKNPPSKLTVKASLSLGNTWGIFVVLLLGYTSSFLLLIVEIAFFKII